MADKHDQLHFDTQPLHYWLTQQQLASRLDISVRSLERMRHDGTGPPYTKAGRKVLYHVNNVDGWLNSRSYQSTAEARHPRAQ